MAMDTSEVLDLSKENIQPLRQGRKAAHLKTALQAQTDPQVQQMLQKKRDEYEYRIRTYEGDDPLEPYFNYVIWLEQSFPKTNRENNLSALLEDTLLKFKDCDKYKQDPRLVQLIVKYIGMQPNPLELYQLVYDQGLGTMCSLLYKAWAEEFDKLNDIKKADRIYNIGINCRAQPLNDLKNAHVQFQLSIARRMIEGSLNPVVSEETNRNVLSSLKASKVKTTRTSRDSAGVLPSIKSTSSINNVAAPSFQVYQEDDRNGPQKSDGRRNDNFPKGSMTERENTMPAGKWNQKHRQSHKMSIIPTTPSFPIHEDPVADCPNVKSDFKPRALKMRREDFNPPVAVFEAQDPTKIPMYPKQLVYVGGRDVQLEEIRAVYYWKKLEKLENEREEMNNCRSEVTDQGENIIQPKHQSMKQTLVEPDSVVVNDLNVQQDLKPKDQGIVPFSDNFDEVNGDVEVPYRNSHPIHEKINPTSREESQFSVPTSRTRHNLCTSMTVNTRNALDIINEMWKSDSSQTEEDFDNFLPSTTPKQPSCVESADENRPAKTGSNAFPVYHDKNATSESKAKVIPVFCDETVAPKENSDAFPVFCDEDTRTGSKRSENKATAFSVFCDEDIISNTKPNTYSVFNDDEVVPISNKVKSNEFPVFCDETVASCSKSSAVSVFCDKKMTQKDDTKLFPAVGEDKSSRTGSKLISVFRDEEVIPATESVDFPDHFPVFAGSNKDLIEDPFDIFDDKPTMTRNQAAFDDYCEGLIANSCKTTSSNKFSNPFSTMQGFKNSFDFEMRTPSTSSRSTYPLNAESVEKEIFRVPCGAPPSTSKSENKSTRFVCSNVTAQDCLDDDEELARPMGSLKMEVKVGNSSNPPLPLIVSVDLDDKPLGPEDKENMPPKDYSTPSERRPLSGILTPAVNVPVREEQSEGSEDEEDLKVPIYGKFLDMDEETCTTKAFTIPLPTSTPFSRSESSKASRKSLIYNGSYIGDENNYPSTSGSGFNNKTPKTPSINPLNDNSKKLTSYSPNLSLILENSKENRGSSSSSSGAAGSTVMRTHWGPSF